VRREAASYRLGCWTFLRLLGLVYLGAFLSLWVQIEGLVGSRGILPTERFFGWLSENLGVERYFEVPTLLWLSHGDAALHALCGVGVLLAALLVAGVAPIPVLFLLWACYLSLVQGGQTFLGFQWDSLLLETGFCALFLAPAALLPRRPSREPLPCRAGLWLMWLLLFKLMFLSGAVKLVSLDRAWWELTALDFHYYTQPLPTWTSWHAQRLPSWFQKASVLLMFAIEMGAPLFAFCGSRGRRLAAAAVALLMLAIGATGNYGFFNVLTLVLCLPLLDDALFGRGPGARTERPGRRWTVQLARGLRTAGVASLIALSALVFVREIVRTRPAGRIDGFAGRLFDAADQALVDSGSRGLLRSTDPFRTINGYGLFRAMTTSRPEIVIEGSDDGSVWKAYEFRWKPGEPTRPPPFVAPHMPRLDWQMWFAALDPRRQGAWLEGLMGRLLEGSPAVLGLLGRNPFPAGPPRYLRLTYYRYEFTTAEERRQGGAWWRRERGRDLTRALALADLRR